MAKIIDFTIPEKVNPFTNDVAELASAGDGKAMEIVVPTVEAKKARFQFAKAANAIGKTARVRSEKVDGKADKDGNPTGDTTFIFTLSEKHKARRGTANTDNGNSAASVTAVK